MKTILTQALTMTKSNWGGRVQLIAGNRRLQRNVARVLRYAPLRHAALAGVLADSRTVEVLGRVSPDEQKLIVGVEMRLGRKLSRARAKALLESYERVKAARQQEATVKAFLAQY